MAAMSKIERVQAVLDGRRPDRPPVSFWHHFAVDQRAGDAAVRAHLNFLNRYDLDFLKVMNDNGYPRPTPLRTLDHLKALPVYNGDEPEFARQLDLLSSLARHLKDRVFMATTIFNAWAALRRLITPKARPGPPVVGFVPAEADELLHRFLAEDRGAVAKAVETVGKSLANFAGRCIDAGADGVFLSCRDDWVDTPTNGHGTYDELVRPADLAVLEAAGTGRFNLLHVCGRAKNFARFAGYPVHVINWADRAAGPSIAVAAAQTKTALCGGVDNLTTMRTGSAGQCAAEVRDALTQAGERPILVGPGCTFDPDAVPPENLHAIGDAARAV